MKLKWWLPFAAVFTAIISVFGWSHFRTAKASQYQTTRVMAGDIHSSVAATGTCNAVVTVQVGSQVSGNIKALYADFNTKVKKGQLVALIDPELFQARVNQARANVDNARAAAVNAKAVVSRLVDELGFDAVDAGGLDDSWRQQPGTPVYGANLTADKARDALSEAKRAR